MKAAVLTTPSPISESPLRIEDVPIPEPPDSPGSGGTIPDYVLLRVRACGVCRTDLHIVEGELPPRNPRIVPGHQIVGEIIAGDLDALTDRVGRTLLSDNQVGTEPALSDRPTGGSRMGAHARPERASARESLSTRVGVTWIGGTDGTCPYCRRNQENLCDFPTFTG